MSKRQQRTLKRKVRGAELLSTGLYVAGVSVTGGGLLAAGIVFAALGGAAALPLGGAIALGSLLAGGVSFWESRRAARRARSLRAELLERQVLHLAEHSGAVLTVTATAQALSIPTAQAEAALDAMVDETRVSMHVTDEGGIEYRFREIEPSKGGAAPRVRVAEQHEEVLHDPEEIMEQAREDL